MNMAEEQQFCLRWNNFQVNITSQFETLRDDEDFVDVTLACEGKRLKAHKVVLSACSPYFKDLFKSNPCKHPILFMRDVEFHHLQSLVEFMYAGEVNIAQAQLSAFLRTAESLQIRGLTEAPQRHKQMDGQSSGRSGSAAGSSKWGGGSPGGGSRTPSPEETEQEAEEEMLSLSPPCSPPPAKRSCQVPDKSGSAERAEETQSSGGNHRSHSNQYDNLKNESMDVIEPKLEVPDYCSDGEGRTDYKSMQSSYQGLDNSVEMSQSFQGLQGGGIEMLPGPSAQNYMGDASQDAAHAFARVRRGRPRMAGYEIQPLNLSGYSIRNGLVSLGEGVEVTEDQLRRVNWGDYRKLTRGLAAILFSPWELATSSVTGQRWSRASLHDGRPCKPALDKNKVRAILTYVTSRFPEIEVSKIKQVLAYKCKESASALKVRLGPVPNPMSRQGPGSISGPVPGTLSGPVPGPVS